MYMTDYKSYMIPCGRFAVIVLGTVLALAVSVQAIGATADKSDTTQVAITSNVDGQADTWQFEITPYLLAAGLNGQVGIHGVTADLDMPFSDIWDTLDSAFMALFTAQKGRWSYGFEGVYFKIADQGSTSVSGPFGNVNVDGALKVTTSVNIYQGSVGYRVMDKKTMVDLIGALRYTQVKADMNVTKTTTPGIVFPGGASSASGSEDWTDAVVGVRVLHPVSKKFSLLGYADVGTGGSDLTYQLIAGLNWEFVEDITAKVGYRLLDWDYKNGGTVWDMQASGMYLGVGFRF